MNCSFVALAQDNQAHYEISYNLCILCLCFKFLISLYLNPVQRHIKLLYLIMCCLSREQVILFFNRQQG